MIMEQPGAESMPVDNSDDKIDPQLRNSDSQDVIRSAADETARKQPSPIEHPLERPLNVGDALGYLDAVKIKFQDEPNVYNNFLDIMKQFKIEQIDTPGVIQRVSHLFKGHPSLIQGFNTFLPSGYRIECSTDASDAGFITVTTPTGTMSTANGPGRKLTWSTAALHEGAAYQLTPSSPESRQQPDYRDMGVDGPTIEPAVQYVQKIKKRCDPEVYRQFLDILSRYHHAPDTIDEEEVSRQIAILFKDDEDLREDFRVFMPDRTQHKVENPSSSIHARDRDKNRRKLDVVANAMSHTSTLPLKRKRKAAEKEREKEPTPIRSAPSAKKQKHTQQDLTPLSYNPKHVLATPSSPRRGSHYSPQQPPAAQPPAPSRQVVNDEMHFFDRVKRVLDNRDLYNEFLKLVNLFAQGYIDTPRLVKESKNFLGNTELYQQFRKILGWDERKEQEHFLAEQHSQSSWTKPAIAALPMRPGRVDLSEKYGSYRKVSASEASMTCQGRDDMCREVLNDNWVSHPTWTSEDSGFISHRKNIYEEALHRSEEERHEYDFHIDAIVVTIAMLEPFNNKIAQMNLEDRANFKLKPNFGGLFKPIHHRVVKKIYGRESGMEVVTAMQENPASAIPVVLGRLKQKEEEWKRAQREWNKVWREVDARNYAKSLDHQAITFKMADKKALTQRNFMHQIETAREEQQARRASLIDPLFSRTRPRYQMEFTMDSETVLQDVVKLSFSFLDRTQGSLTVLEKKRIENFLRTYIPLFFAINTVDFNSTIVVHDMVESDSSDVDMASVGDENDGSVTTGMRSSRNGRGKASNVGSGGDLRKKLLKSEQAKSTGRKTRAQEAASPSVSRFASPVTIMEEDRGEGSSPLVSAPSISRSSKICNVFYTNTTFYVLMRLVEVLYSRLVRFKSLTSKLSTPIMPEGSMSKTDSPQSTIYYDMLLGLCERLFTNEIEVHAFEDQIRANFGLKDAYKIFTVDKVIGIIIKQAQAVIADPKSQELLELLKRERSMAAPTSQDRMNYRHQVEQIMGPDENVFRIDWLSDLKNMTIQLIGKDDSNVDDSEAITGRWQAYIDAYVSGETTEGVLQSKVRQPFLRRNLPSSHETQPDVSSQDRLEIKVCVRTYRVFYVSNTEDIMWRYRSKDEVEKNTVHLRKKNMRRRLWLEKDCVDSREIDGVIECHC